MSHYSIHKLADLMTKILPASLYPNAYKTVQHLQAKKVNTAIITQFKQAGLYPNAYKTVQHLQAKTIFTGNRTFLVK